MRLENVAVVFFPIAYFSLAKNLNFFDMIYA